MHAYHKLRELEGTTGVSARGRRPLLCGSLLGEALPAARLTRFRGILNSTTNLILTEMGHSNRCDAAVKKAQDLGIAEIDSSFDVDGWDATVKVSWTW